MLYDILRRVAVRHVIARNVCGRKARSLRALVSYIVHPFLPINRSSHHTNLQEARALTEILDREGFSVDVVDSRVSPRVISDKYDLYFGFGDALEAKAATLRSGQRLIAYATGRAAPYQARETMRRGLDFQRIYGVFPRQSLRLPNALWQWQITMADALIVIGDALSAQTFDYYPAPPNQIRRAVPATYAATNIDSESSIKRDWSSARSQLLWFGGAGVVHKGLDLCIAAVSRLPDVTLHVCGVPRHEQPLVNDCLSRYANVGARIKMHGFVHPQTKTFAEISSSCGFAILPSCSEGQATSVLTCVARGGLIPIISDRCGCSEIPSPFTIAELSDSAVADAIQRARATDAGTLADVSSNCVRHVTTHHSIESYRTRMRAAISEAIQ